VTNETDPGRGALENLRVIDFSRLGPGPLATMMLGDLGADVIRVEEPGGGRRARDERALRGEAPDAYSSAEWRWRSINPVDRNKRSIAIDLREDGGREIARRLFTTADVVIEGFRPGVMKRLGLDYDVASSLNSRLIYCSITGYGHVGPRSAVTGHDLTYLAYAGALGLIGNTDGRPVVPINVIADYAAGSLRAVTAILAALIARAETGEGRFIDLALADGVVALLAVELARFLSSGEVPKAGTTYLTGGAAYYNVYEACDGKWIAIACNEPHFFRRLCEMLDVPELADRQLGDPAEQSQMYDVLSERFQTRSSSEWCELLGSAGVPCDPVRTIDEIVEDEHFRERGLFVTLDHPDFGAMTQVGETLGLSAASEMRLRPAVMPGADGRELLSELGYEDGEIDELIATNVVTQSRPHDPGY
jgi:crotonobetainyl-CoA:carnitine CoA-transferase CaiB-like acyl-CoA transferase